MSANVCAVPVLVMNKAKWELLISSVENLQVKKNILNNRVWFIFV